MSVPLDVKISFIELIIRSFSPRRGHANAEARENWIRTQVTSDMTAHLDELFELLFDPITILEDAKHERNQLLQQQTSKFI